MLTEVIANEYFMHGVTKGIPRMKLLPYHVVTEHILQAIQKLSLQQIDHSYGATLGCNEFHP